MNLGTRVKNALHSPESTVASHGDVDTNTPGAYPVDTDTPVNESGPDTMNPATSGSKSTHNKLHKRNDPRGWADDSAGGIGHQHTDSGVGLTQEHDTSPPRQPGAIPETGTEGAYTYNAPGTTGDMSQTTYGRDDTQQQSWREGETDTKPNTLRHTGALGATPLDSRREAEEPDYRQQTTGMTESDPSTTGIGATGAGIAGASTERGAAKSTRQPGDVAQEHPYWGDLPQGAGVYNTVTGHGSDEDQRKRQQELYSQETQGLSGQHPSTVAGLSDPSRVQGPSSQTTTRPSEYQTQRDTFQPEDQRDSRKTETLMGAGGAATATAAAATAYKMHDRDSRSEEEDRMRESQQEERPVEEKRERRRSFGLFHRSKEGDDHHTKEKVKEEKIKEEKAKPADEPKSEKKHRLGGLFHRSSVSDDKREDDAARDIREREEADKTRDHSNTAAYAATGADLGAGSTAAYMAGRDRKDDDEQIRDRSATGQQYQSARIANEPQRTQAFGTQTGSERQYQDPSTLATHGVYDERESKDSHKMATAAAAGATGLGAGAYLSQDRDDKGTTSRDDDVLKSREHTFPASESTTRDPHVYAAARTGPSDISRDTTRTGDNLTRGVDPLVGASGAAATRTAEEPSIVTGHANKGQYSMLGSGTPSGVDPMNSGTSSSAAQTTREPPAIADHANQGEYNMLASGTPSGVRLDNRQDTLTQSQPTIPETHEKGYDKSQMAAAGIGAAGLGAATAAAHRSRDPAEEKKLEPAEEAQVQQYEREEARPKTESRTIPLVGGRAPQQTEKVFHRCHNCGEENDISSYFTQERK